MEVASRNFQDRLDSNLWKWPTEWSGTTKQVNIPGRYTPIVGKWYGWVNAKYVLPDSMSKGSFGPDFVTSASSSGYSMGICLDLAPFKTYKLTADHDRGGIFSMNIWHVDENTGICDYFGRVIDDVTFSGSGKVEMVFTMPEDYVLWKIASSSSGIENALTLRNIKIMEI